MCIGGKTVLAVTCTALLASPALAQQKKGGGFGGFGFGGGRMSAGQLLQNEGVQKDLKLTEDQIAKVKEVGQKVREKYTDDFQKLRDLDQQERREKMTELMKKVGEDTDKELAGVLKPEQDKRLKQIQRQTEGVQAFQEPDVQKALKLTDEQKDSLKTIAEDSQKDLRDSGKRPSAVAAATSRSSARRCRPFRKKRWTRPSPYSRTTRRRNGKN